MFFMYQQAGEEQPLWMHRHSVCLLAQLGLLNILKIFFKNAQDTHNLFLQTQDPPL
jgi:hypothetical protein